jgi:acetolactate synthase-1/3 small subunit
MVHVISALVQNEPGVLAHVAGMFAGRGYNITSLTVGETEQPEMSRMTIAVDDQGDPTILEQIRKQLAKVVNVVKVMDFSARDCVYRDMLLIKVAVPPERRAEVLSLVEVFEGKVVDIGQRYVMVEITGPGAKTSKFIEVMRPFGIKETVRTGTIAMTRGWK